MSLSEEEYSHHSFDLDKGRSSSPLSGESMDYSIVPRLPNIAYLAAVSHLLYALASLALLYLAIQFTFRKQGVSTNFSTTAIIIVSLFLFVDNMRYFLAIFRATPRSVLYMCAMISYFGHEVITPVCILFPADLLARFLPNRNAIWIIWIILMVLALLFMTWGANRFFHLPRLSVEEEFGLPMYRPENRDFTALIPIFLTVFLLIVTGGLSLRFVKPRRYQLFVCQLLVFVLNGALAPAKAIFFVAGNALEILWITSIFVASVEFS